MTLPLHVAINPLWRCQLVCDYCWRPWTHHDAWARERPWQEWARGLTRALPADSMVDISGGEPLLFPGLLDLGAALGAAGINWAVTTNAMETRVLEALIKRRPPGLALILVSAHAGNPQWPDAVAMLRGAGLPVAVNQVGHVAASPVSGEHNVITYQPWEEGTALDSKVRICDAGRRHWVAGPDGTVWRCQVRLQMGAEPIGNVIDGPMDVPAPIRCDLGCSTCYTDHPAAWKVSWVECR